MWLRTMMLVYLLCCSSLSFADICPDITDIKTQKLKGWIAYDSYDHRRVTRSKLRHFTQAVKQFALAEWENNNHGTGNIHCYYTDRYGSNLNTYLQKNNFLPDNSSHYWYKVSGFHACAAGMEACQFNIKKQKKLAQN